MNQPEKLNLWDRLFNRYRRSVIGRGQSVYKIVERGPYKDSYVAHWVDYHVIDRLTGGEFIKRKWLGKAGYRQGYL